jgi:8-oxo-dGTP pyrophosphatase MutT (NUDIX family)
MTRIGLQQVAAVCFRCRAGKVEFMLVRTSGGRWTFPKGKLPAGIPPELEACREAYEEAGVVGYCHSPVLTTYRHARGVNGDAAEFDVTAYLLQVLATVEPPEVDRQPTWFDANEAKIRLAERRSDPYARELAQVVDLAIERVTAQVRLVSDVELPRRSA